MPTPEQEFDKDIAKMQELLARVKREYDLFFAGNRREPPHKEAKELEGMVRKWRNANITNYAVQFRLQSFLSTYSIQNEMWNKWVRQKEEGLAKDPRLVAAVRRGREVMKELDKGHVEKEREEEAEGASPTRKPAEGAKEAEPPKESPEAATRRLYEEFIRAKMAEGEAPEMDFGAFERRLAKQREELAKKYGGQDVSFTVVAKDGKVSLKAKVSKRSQTPE